LTLLDLNKGEKAIISDIETDKLPLKLIEMGCLPGNEIELIQLAPFNDPMYLNVNGCRLSIRRDTAQYISICK
jgi:ferrous iron transport protein A